MQEEEVEGHSMRDVEISQSSPLWEVWFEERVLGGEVPASPALAGEPGGEPGVSLHVFGRLQPGQAEHRHRYQIKTSVLTV